MRAWILGIALVGATGGGVAFVLAGKGDEQSHCGPCIEAKAKTPAAEASADDGCPSCNKSRPADAADVTDLGALLAGGSDASRPRLSFEEPPFAAPTTAAVREIAPMPHALAITEVCPMPRLTSETVAEVAPMPRLAK